MLAVVRSKPKVENINMLIKKQTDEEKKLSELMIPKKNKRLYNKIMYSKKKEKQEVIILNFKSYFNSIFLTIWKFLKVQKLKEKRQKYEESVKKTKVK